LRKAVDEAGADGVGSATSAGLWPVLRGKVSLLGKSPILRISDCRLWIFLGFSAFVRPVWNLKPRRVRLAENRRAKKANKVSLWLLSYKHQRNPVT
jgi:hypothetical protein